MTIDSYISDASCKKETNKIKFNHATVAKNVKKMFTEQG
jgi:hypothetical protein